MTLTTLNKLRQRDGVTLVELLVVMLIVAILAIGLLPTFVKFVVKAQYTTDAIPLVNHIRTQVDLYRYENGKLPCYKGTEDAVWRIILNSGKYEFDTTTITPVSCGVDEEGQSATELPSYLDGISVQLAEMQGRRLRPENVEFAVIANTNSYGYAVGVFGDGTDEGLPGNSGYAVLEIDFADVEVGGTAGTGAGGGASGGSGGGATPSTTLTGDVARGYKFVAEWSNYEKGTTRAHFAFGTSDGTTKQVGIPSCATLFQDPTVIPEAAMSILAAPTKKFGTTVGTCAYGKWTYTAVPSGFLQP